jgi:hypothetical protein
MLEQFLKNLIPSYILEKDSYKDVDGKGFVERYLEIFGQELDDNTLASLEDYEISTIDVNLTAEKFLDYYEDLQGDIKNFGTDTAARRSIIKYIISIYSIKGTKESIKQILATRGYKVNTITEHDPVEYRYDGAGVNYDDPLVKYDEVCQGCSEITIDMDKNYVEAITVAELVVIDQLLDLVLPIDTTIRDITINGDSIFTLIKAVYLDTEGDSGIGDPQGDLYYLEDDPLGEINLAIDSNGDLIITGVDVSHYSLNGDGDLIYTT